MTRMHSRAAELAGVFREAARLDREWMKSPAGHDSPVSTPWMPFPMYDFIALVAEALPECEGSAFLEVGCGCGTRMWLAQEVFGLDAHGIERVPEYVAQAASLGLDAEVADALGWGGYGNYDLIWFNRPFSDRLQQAKLERQVWDDMKPGAVVICANLEGSPPGSWPFVLLDMEVRRGIWRKPA